MGAEHNKALICGVKFCGGCNPRYDRSQAFAILESRTGDRVKFDYAEEDVTYDLLLVIGGCTNCCASYKELKTINGVIKMWDEKCVEDIVLNIKKII